MRTVGSAFLGLVFATSTLGCASQRALTDRSASAGISPCSFWPPPPSSSITFVQGALPAHVARQSRTAARIASELRSAGYNRARWYPIGLGCAHGFAATTRLEALGDDHTPSPDSKRWSSLYPDPATLRWLTLARRMPLPHPGRYRVFLLAVTDLPIGKSALAPVWNADTVMDGAGVGMDCSFGSEEQLRGDLTSYQLAVYVYEYERRKSQLHGEFSTLAGEGAAISQLRQAGLSRLLDSSLFDGE